jgi:hypothetical protein
MLLTVAGGTDMAKEKIVRCRISKMNADTGDTSVRYVPLEIFQLWKLLMSEKHGFTIEDDCVSLWFDIDGDPHVNYARSNYERVVKLQLCVYSEEAGMFREIVRYFPNDDYERIKQSFLAHYRRYFSGSRFSPRLEEVHGVWLRREDA